MKKYLSHTELMAQLTEQAKNRTKQEKQKQSGRSTQTSSLEKIKKQLNNLGYTINDEEGLKEIIGTDTSLKFEKINILAERGIIALNEQELDNSTPKPPVIVSISEAEIPSSDTKEEAKTDKEATLSRIASLNEKRKDKHQQTLAQEQKQDIDFEEKYIKSLEKWCQKTTDKKTGKIKREIKSIQKTDNENNETQIEIIPLNPIAAKRGDNGAVYKIKKGAKPNQTDVTLGSSEPGKPLNYDYFYALVKAAHDSGADTIEFKDIKTPEFRDKLLAAALQFKMKVKNPPKDINLEANYMQTIPSGCRHYLELYKQQINNNYQHTNEQIINKKKETFLTNKNQIISY